jgi:NitT/TauT family transport system substrate-binding protein
VMTGQIDVGWSVVPFGLSDVADGKIRIIGRARDVAEMRNQTIRVNVVNAEILKNKRAAITKFMQVYEKAIDWAYSNPQAIEIFARNMKVTPAVAKQAVDEYYPKSAMQMAEIRDVERTLQDALEAKVITSPKTPKDLEGLFDIVHKPAK